MSNEKPTQQWSRQEIASALCRMAAETNRRVALSVKPMTEVWTVHGTEGEEEGTIVVIGDRAEIIDWMREEGITSPGWPERAWLQIGMTAAFGEVGSCMELREQGTTIVRLIHKTPPTNKGFGKGGWVVERDGRLDPDTTKIDERMEHPMFGNRKDAIKYAEALADGANPVGAEPQSETVTVSYRTPSR